MITFREKSYSEYDAMRSLYVELTKYDNKNKVEVIDKSSLIPVLRVNNIVIERFVISTNLFGKDRYRMYLKIGAKAKLPDDVRLPGRSYDRKLGNMSLNFNPPGSVGGTEQQRNNSDTSEKTFSGGNKSKGGSKPLISGSIVSSYDIKQTVQKLLGDAILYDKKTRSLILEFDSIQDAISALNILPFGIDYKIYLLS